VNQDKLANAGGIGAALFLVPATADRLVLGRTLAAPLLSSSSQEVERAKLRGHPDLLELVAPDGKERIGIAQVRDLIRSAQFSPVQGDRKVCLIPRAEALTPEASNALLKIMEEPPRGLAFVLLADHPSDLLPTIVSRSRVVRYTGASSNEIQSQFQHAGYSEEEATWLTRQSLRDGEADVLMSAPIDLQNALTASRTFLATADILQHIEACLGNDVVLRQQAFCQLLLRLESQDPDLMTAGIRVLATQDRDVLVQFLHELLACSFEILRSAASSSPLDADETRELLDRVRADRLLAFCLAIGDAHQSLRVYGPIEGNLLSLFLGFKGAVHAR